MVLVIVDHWSGHGYQLVTRKTIEDNIQIALFGACSEPYIKTVSQAVAIARQHATGYDKLYRETTYTIREVGR